MSAEVVAAQVSLYAKELKMPGLAGAFQQIVCEADAASRSHAEALVACLSVEVASGAEHRLAARLKAVRFPAPKSLEGSDFALQPSLERARVLSLAGGEFITARENLVCLGGSGTDKTQLATAVGIATIYAGFQVRFTGAITLA